MAKGALTKQSGQTNTDYAHGIVPFAPSKAHKPSWNVRRTSQREEVSTTAETKASTQDCEAGKHLWGDLSFGDTTIAKPIELKHLNLQLRGQDGP